MRNGFKYLSKMPLYPSQTLYNMYADADDENEIEAVYSHILNNNAIQHPDYVDVVELLGEEPYGPYNEAGIQRRIDAYLAHCRQWGGMNNALAI
ncbi:hypothetical protein [Bacillus sp. UNC322MFChir4.1]|uniref:hypothetical protein n=1 Tax=Bacillus sp. UNC322MFChir4.1 TaxID=1449045 RepID=UPI0005564603|nr:hypothetical protein [Bacillus sp. UNC322MFChir4.1]